MALLGTLILLFGWFGFNAASTFAATDLRFTVAAANTGIAAAFGLVTGMAWIMLRRGKPDPGMMANGMLAGLVAITAPCAFVQPWAAAVIGIIASVLVIEAIFIVENKFKIDDPVGAISVHGVNGIFGVLAVGVFADGSYGAGWNLTTTTDRGVTGILYGISNLDQLAAQAIGAAVILVVFGTVSFAFFKIQNALTKGGIRSDGGARAGRPRPARDGPAGVPRVHRDPRHGASSSAPQGVASSPPRQGRATDEPGRPPGSARSGESP